MQNDMLKNTVAPWQEEGRWYHALYDFSTKNFVPEETDSFLLDATMIQLATSGYARVIYILDKKHPIIDIKCKFHDDFVTPTTNNVDFGGIRNTTLGYGGRIFALDGYAGMSGFMDLWIFIG